MDSREITGRVWAQLQNWVHAMVSGGRKGMTLTNILMWYKLVHIALFHYRTGACTAEDPRFAASSEQILGVQPCVQQWDCGLQSGPAQHPPACQGSKASTAPLVFNEIPLYYSPYMLLQKTYVLSCFWHLQVWQVSQSKNCRYLPFYSFTQVSECRLTAPVESIKAESFQQFFT